MRVHDVWLDRAFFGACKRCREGSTIQSALEVSSKRACFVIHSRILLMRKDL